MCNKNDIDIVYIPRQLLTSILKNVELEIELDTTKETIIDKFCVMGFNGVSKTNAYAIKNYWKAMSQTDFKDLVKLNIDKLICDLNTLKVYIKE